MQSNCLVGECFFECCAIANVDFDQLVTWIFEVVANVRAFDLGIVEVVEVVDNGDVFDVRSEQSIDEV